MRPAPSAFAQTSGKGAVRGWGLTKARVRVRDGLEGVPVEKGSAAMAVLALGVVLAVFAHAPADPAAGQVHAHVEVTAVSVAVTATSWERRGLTEGLTQVWEQPRWHPTHVSPHPPLLFLQPLHPPFMDTRIQTVQLGLSTVFPGLSLCSDTLSEMCSQNV